MGFLWNGKCELSVRVRVGGFAVLGEELSLWVCVDSKECVLEGDREGIDIVQNG
jgi:hypothetical protein